MKTLAVLSALAAIAIAAPTIEDYADSTRLSPGDFVITQRDKKSTTLETKNIPGHLENLALEQASNKEESSNHDARTFSGFKKPIIVKKIGYHAYREGEEQSQLDSQEKCRKQMEAKLCEDIDSKDKVKSASVGHHDEISEREMVHSINVAKEAVHTFERDLQRMEHECSEHKHRHTTLASDTQLHDDIEKARQALEHIHTHFKNAKSDEERRIKWKEAGKLHDNVEIGKNLEDNFKNSGDAITEFKTTIEDIDTPFRSNNEAGDGMTSIVEDKNRKLKIHSDNLIKASTMNEDDNKKLENVSGTEHQAGDQEKMIDKNVNSNNHEIPNHHHEDKETKEQTIEGQDSKLKLMEIKGDDLNVEEKKTRNHLENNEKLKSSDDHSSSDIHELRKELEKENSNAKLSHGNEQVMHGFNHVDTMPKTDTLQEGVTTQNDQKLHLHHDNFEQRNREHLQTDDSKKDIPHQMDLQTESHNSKSVDLSNMDTQRAVSTMAISKLDNEKDSEKSHFTNHIDSHANNDPALLRATSDFNKEFLNNMDFADDPHHRAIHQPSLTDDQMMKNEKQELHERINVPGVHPNTEHLKTMMHFSDNSHHVTPHLKMASTRMFNNQEPNLNVQVNSPQDFVEQTNIQDFMPFRTIGDLHDTGLDKRLKTIHNKDDMPTELHDPLTVHRAHLDNMQMDGSSQHFNIEQLNPLRSNLLNDHQHLSLNEQLRAQQQWAHAKSIHNHQLSPMNTGLEHMHAQDTFVSRNGHNMMMHEKSNIDNTMQPSSLMQMRGTPKMALERTGPNQWAHTHGAYRSSYGPSLSPSYGSGGGASYGGSTVGVFPNANVGNCAVPILLSCSPSVVSGSLAKTQSSYSAPAYRSEDINFLKKRGVDIDELNQGPQLRHTPLDKKTKVVLEKNNNTA